MRPMTIRSMSMTAPSTATSSACARSSRWWPTISTRSRRCTAWATATRSKVRLPHFSTLTWRIIAFNAIALVVLTAGVILVQSSGRGLVEERLTSVQEQAAIVAGALAQYTTDPDSHTLKTELAEPLLRELIAPTRLRARLYLPDGKLAVD